MITIKTPHQIELMRESGKVMKGIFIGLRDVIKAGISTKDIDRWVYDYITSHGCKPSCLNYEGFPASACVSPNDVIVHGIPRDDIILQEGDIVSVDLCVNYKGIHTDACRTFAVGKMSPEAQQLIDVTKQAFFEAIKGLKAGSFVGDIGEAVQKFVEPKGYSLVREMQGHGIGLSIHEDPGIPNYGKAGTGYKLRENMAICIEPMVNMGSRHIKIDRDGWTCRTRDGKWAAHYENTILIKKDGIEIMTLEDENE